jgi:hypothetical protein
MRSWTGRQILAALFYVALAVVLAACLVPFAADVLPAGIATKITHNSEGYLIALVLVPWIQFVRDRLSGRRAEWAVTVAVAVVLLAIGIALILTHLPSRFRTLNEAFIAASVLVPYVQVRRPLPRWIPVGLVLAVVVLTLVLHNNAEVTDLAEVVGALVLVPLTLDLVDRGILEPGARTSAVLRYGWYAVLVIVPVVLSVLESHHDLSGGAQTAVRFLVRTNEDWICALLVSLQFAVILGRTGRSVEDPRASGRAEPALGAAH